MRCPNCGVENDGGARFCSNCGHAFAAAAGAGAATPPGEPTAPTTPAGAEPTQPVAPAAGEQTQPDLPPTPSKVMMTPTPPGAPPPPAVPAPAPGGGPAKRPSPAVLAIGGALAVVVLGLIVWAVFLREDDPAPVTLPTPTAAPTGQAQPTGSAGTTGTTGVTGVTGTVTGTTGTTGATGATGAFTTEVQLCESVTAEGECTNPYPYDPASGWTIPVTAPSFTVLVTTEGLQPGDVISIDFQDVLRNNRSYYTEDFDAAPAEVVDYEQWLYWLPLVTPQTGSFPPESTTELVVTHNGTPIEFQGPNVYTFA